MRRWRTVRPDSTGRVRVADGQRHPRPPAPPTPLPPSGLENFPEPAELVTETAGVEAELRQQIGALAIIGVYLVRELLAGLLSRRCRLAGRPAARSCPRGFRPSAI
jgi:hypothetical protein